MAQKRMFSKAITNAGRFLDMPLSSQALYFHLGIQADDDGFCEYKTVMRMVGFAQDDLKVLVTKQFIKLLDEYVVFVVDWKENNYIRSDRYSPSIYLSKFGMALGIPMVARDKNNQEKKNIEEISRELVDQRNSNKVMALLQEGLNKYRSDTITS